MGNPKNSHNVVNDPLGKSKYSDIRSGTRSVKWIFEANGNGLDNNTETYHWERSPRIGNNDIDGVLTSNIRNPGHVTRCHIRGQSRFCFHRAISRALVYVQNRDCPKIASIARLENSFKPYA
jgi:hypothetical protein